MKKIIINSKIKIDGDLNFKNLSSLNLLIPSLKNISNLKLLYKNIYVTKIRYKDSHIRTFI